jgi:hypothetical protein
LTAGCSGGTSGAAGGGFGRPCACCARPCGTMGYMRAISCRAVLPTRRPATALLPGGRSSWPCRYRRCTWPRPSCGGRPASGGSPGRSLDGLRRRPDPRRQPPLTNRYSDVTRHASHQRCLIRSIRCSRQRSEIPYHAVLASQGCVSGSRGLVGSLVDVTIWGALVRSGVRRVRLSRANLVTVPGRSPMGGAAHGWCCNERR